MINKDPTNTKIQWHFLLCVDLDLFSCSFSSPSLPTAYNLFYNSFAIFGSLYYFLLSCLLLSCRLDKTKFYVVGAGIFTGLTVGLYLISVVKTRLQVASKDAAERNAFSVIKGLLKTEGVPGLYRGFGTVITGAVPARIIFLTALETTKVAAFKMVEPFKLSEPAQAAIANGLAGMTASLFSQAVFVPIDVVCCTYSHLTV